MNLDLLNLFPLTAKEAAKYGTFGKTPLEVANCLAWFEEHGYVHSKGTLFSLTGKGRDVLRRRKRVEC